jgi:SPP1 gp7 family putative phage head morphogenesis protein
LAADPHIRALIKLYNHACACTHPHAGTCTHGTPFLALKGDAALIDNLYDNGTGGVNDALLQRYAGGFDKAVNNVFGAGRQHPELAQELRVNAGRFGTYKTYDLCRQLDAARQSGMSKDEFQKFAKARIGVYNAHQRTEYNTLTARSRTAKQWERFSEEKFLYPNIEWLQTGSANPRPEHLAFVGLILPQDDPFWQRNQPGNEYNCKCDWRTTDVPASTERVPDDIPPAKGLDGNPAETGELVTGRHPYFERNTHAPSWVGDKALLQLPNDVAYVERTTGTGKTYREHRTVDGVSGAVANREIASLLLDNGRENVRLLPKIHAKETILRERYFGKQYAKLYPATNPDAFVDGSLVEFKTSNIKQITHNIGKAAKQSDGTVLIRITEPVQEHYLNDKIAKQWTMPDRNNIHEIIVIANGEVQVFTKK